MCVSDVLDTKASVEAVKAAGGDAFGIGCDVADEKSVKAMVDAVIAKYRIAAPGIELLARIVRGADTDAKGLEPESYGLQAMAEGFRAIAKDDHEILRLEFPVYDALYAYCKARAER